MNRPKLDLTPFQTGDSHGYSCQSVIARRVNEYLHEGSYYCWLSEKFDPPNTGNSSNPSWLYSALSHAVHADDSKDAKISQIRDTLRTVMLEAISRGWKQKANSELIKNILEIRQAPVELFRPQIWRIHLWKVASSRASGGQYQFEKLVKDLTCQEFDIIIE